MTQPTRRARGIKYGAALTLLATICVAAVSSSYTVSPGYVAKTLVRGMALYVIGISVRLYDPSGVTITETGPPTSAAAMTSGREGAGELLALLERRLPGCASRIICYDNSPFAQSSFRFGYQPVGDDRLLQLRKQEGLDRVVAGQPDDFGQLTALADWVNSRWQHGTSGRFDPTYFDARDILAQSRRGATFWCHVAAMTFIQAAASLGFQGRLVSLSRTGYLPEHAVAEVWCNRFRKWVMIDPDFNIWYTRNNVPLSVLEIHQAMMQGRGGDLGVVRGGHRPTAELELRIPLLPAYYAYFEVDLRNDWLTNRYFPGHPARSDAATLQWKDERLPPLLDCKTAVDDASQLYWDLNRTKISFLPGSSSGWDLVASFQTVTPNFSHFRVTLDGGTVLEDRVGAMTWRLHTGRNTLTIRSINSYGQEGIASEVALTLAQRAGSGAGAR